MRPGDIVIVNSPSMELVIPIAEPNLYVDLEEGTQGFIKSIDEDSIIVQFGDNILCEFEFEDFEHDEESTAFLSVEPKLRLV
jgi:hypothetical protein